MVTGLSTEMILCLKRLNTLEPSHVCKEQKTFSAPKKTGPPFQLRAHGEIAIRCRDFAGMQDFYSRILGLPVKESSKRGGYGDGLVFYRLGERFGGHVSVLALFDSETASVSLPSDDMEVPVQASLRSSLHHLALSLPWEEQEAAAGWLTQQGFDAKFQNFPWAGWWGLFTRDPDGNTVELVAAAPEWHFA